MDMRTLFPSRFFRVEDLNPGGLQLTIGNVTMEQVLAEWKPVIYFRGHEKGLVLNQTNNKLLMSMPGFGHDSNAWVGKDIVLFIYSVIQNGQPAPRIGVRMPGTVEAAQQPQAYTPLDYSKPTPQPYVAPGPAPYAGPPVQPRPPLRDEMNDEIPF